MRSGITKEYLDSLRQKLIDLEEAGDSFNADFARTEYRTACAQAYSCGSLVWKDEA